MAKAKSVPKNPEITFYELDAGQFEGLSVGKTVTITLTGKISRLSDSDYGSSLGIRTDKIEVDGKELSMEDYLKDMCEGCYYDKPQ